MGRKNRAMVSGNTVPLMIGSDRTRATSARLSARVVQMCGQVSPPWK